MVFLGLVTGVVMDIGDGVTHICPVYEGRTNPITVKRLDIAGSHITEHLIRVRQYNLIHLFCFSQQLIDHIRALLNLWIFFRIAPVWKLLSTFRASFKGTACLQLLDSTGKALKLTMGSNVYWCYLKAMPYFDILLHAFWFLIEWITWSSFSAFKLLQLRGYAFNRSSDGDTVREIKEKLCYIRFDDVTLSSKSPSAFWR